MGTTIPTTWMMILLLVSVIQISVAAPPSPTVAKRSDEILQFGNQQNKAVSVLDDDILPGTFPSSENTEIADAGTPTIPEPEGGEVDEGAVILQNEVEEPDQKPLPVSYMPRVPPGEHHPPNRTPPEHREEMIRDIPPVALASRWGSPAEYYNPHWAMRPSTLYGAVDDGTFPIRRRRRAIEHSHPITSPTTDPRHSLQVSLHALRTGHRHKRDVHDIRRIRRDLSNIDLDKLRREVDVVELLSMLAKPPRHHNNGFATVSYAPLAPAPPRFAPQPKLFPDYEDEEEEEEEEEEDEDDEDGSLGMLSHGMRPPMSRVMMPPDDRIWRRSRGYGLSAMPGFKKRSAFRANNPSPPVRNLNPGDVYSLAAMLGAELDPVTHRIRRAAM